MSHSPTPNDQRSTVKNPNNPQHQQDLDNRARQQDSAPQSDPAPHPDQTPTPADPRDRK